MGKWWIIPEVIIAQFFTKWKERDGITIFKGEALPLTIKKFIGSKELENLNQTLFDTYQDKNKKPGQDTLKRAINARDSPGVFIETETDKDLLDLICYYAVGKNWSGALIEYSIKETDIPKLSKAQNAFSKHIKLEDRSILLPHPEVESFLLKITKCDPLSQDQAEHFYNAGLIIAERAKNEFSRARLNGVYGIFLVRNNEKLVFARQILKNSLDYSKTHSLTEEQLILLAKLSKIELKIGDPELAEIYIEDYLTIAKDSSKILNEAWAYSILGLIESIKKEDLKSISYYQMAI